MRAWVLDRTGLFIHQTKDACELFKKQREPRTRIACRGSRLVPVAGVEPARCCHRRILSPLRLPIPSHRLIFVCVPKSLSARNRHFTLNQLKKQVLCRKKLKVRSQKNQYSPLISLISLSMVYFFAVWLRTRSAAFSESRRKSSGLL